mmetsp:Transcript_31034/g.79159  ORF Transcript_31034/g.79159 Transcript_31034/m.79159 type:complete len:297 (-) Transcript_31034:937-1827(-)
MKEEPEPNMEGAVLPPNRDGWLPPNMEPAGWLAGAPKPPRPNPPPVLPNMPPVVVVPKALPVVGPNRLVPPNADDAGLAAPKVVPPKGLEEAPNAGAEDAPKGLPDEGPNRLLPALPAELAPKGDGAAPKGDAPAAGADVPPNSEGLELKLNADPEEAAPNAGAVVPPNRDEPVEAPNAGAAEAPNAGALDAPKPPPNAGVDACWPNAGWLAPKAEGDAPNADCDCAPKALLGCEPNRPPVVAPPKGDAAGAAWPKAPVLVDGSPKGDGAAAGEAAPKGLAAGPAGPAAALLTPAV